MTSLELEVEHSRSLPRPSSTSESPTREKRNFVVPFLASGVVTAGSHIYLNGKINKLTETVNKLIEKTVVLKICLEVDSFI